jgi:hypothetical protein
MLCDLGNVLKYLADNGTVFLGNIVNRLDMRLGDHKNVNGCLGIDIIKSEDIVVFIYLL